MLLEPVRLRLRCGEAAVNRVWLWLGLPHWYLSTGCLHGGDGHTYCQNVNGRAGAKTPATCKHCGARCRCRCHRRTAPRTQPHMTVLRPPGGGR